MSGLQVFFVGLEFLYGGDKVNKEVEVDVLISFLIQNMEFFSETDFFGMMFQSS